MTKFNRKENSMLFCYIELNPTHLTILGLLRSHSADEPTPLEKKDRDKIEK